jgi:hypothetical protein
MKKEIVKSVINVVVGIGVGAVINNAIGATTPRNSTELDKVKVFVGSCIIAGLITKVCVDYVEETMEGIKKIYDDYKDSKKEAV